jgi:hypothetical protein
MIDQCRTYTVRHAQCTGCGSAGSAAASANAGRPDIAGESRFAAAMATRGQYNFGCIL